MLDPHLVFSNTAEKAASDLYGSGVGTAAKARQVSSIG